MPNGNTETRNRHRLEELGVAADGQKREVVLGLAIDSQDSQIILGLLPNDYRLHFTTALIVGIKHQLKFGVGRESFDHMLARDEHAGLVDADRGCRDLPSADSKKAVAALPL